jgi:hypothetical protein
MTIPDSGNSNNKKNCCKYYPHIENLPAHLTWFFTLLLAIFAFNAWQETRLDFQLDQRPILDVSDTPVPGYKDGPDYGHIVPDHVAWNYMIKNYGKGAAFDVRICPFIRIGGSQFIASNNGNYGENSEIVPTKFIWQTVVFPDAIEPQEVKKIIGEDYGIAMKLIIFYKDTFKTTYRKVLCQLLLPGGAIAVSRCASYPFIYFIEDKNKCETTYQ